ncbi:MAG: hypothetical protein QW291_00875 [Thermofilaceae archaeon]
MTLSDILESEYLLVHEVVEMSELKKKGGFMLDLHNRDAYIWKYLGVGGGLRGLQSMLRVDFRRADQQTSD